METRSNGVIQPRALVPPGTRVVPSGPPGPGLMAAVNTNTVRPSTPPDGTLWYDTTNARLMLYIGSWFQVA